MCPTSGAAGKELCDILAGTGSLLCGHWKGSSAHDLGQTLSFLLIQSHELVSVVVVPQKSESSLLYNSATQGCSLIIWIEKLRLGFDIMLEAKIQLNVLSDLMRFQAE